MMKRILSLISLFCVASVLAQAGVAVTLWNRGALNPQTAQELLTVAYDIPIRQMYDDAVMKARPVKAETVSFAEVQDARMLAALDLDLREMSCDKGLLDLRELGLLLDNERGRYSVIKDKFDLEWANLQKGASDSSLRELQHQLESLSSKAAKDQILRILDSPNLSPDVAMNQIVTIFKSMAVDKRKKIVAEFKENDSQRLQDILRQIRLGMPEVDLIRATRLKLQEFQLPE